MVVAHRHRPPRRAIAVGLLLALGVALVAGAYAYRRPSPHTSTITVFLTQFAATSNANSSGTAVADFETAARLPEVQRAAAEQAGTSSEATRSTTITQVGQSSAVTVSAHGSSSTTATTIAEAVTTLALRALSQQAMDGASDQRTAAQDLVSAISGQVTSLDSRLGVNDVNSAVLQLEQYIGTLKDKQFSSPSPSLATLITQSEAQLDKLAAALGQSTQLNTELAQAQSTLQTANQRVVAAQGMASAITSPSVLTAPQLTQASRLTSILRTTIGAGVITVALEVVALLLLGRRDRTRPRGPDEPAPARVRSLAS